MVDAAAATASSATDKHAIFTDYEEHITQKKFKESTFNVYVKYDYRPDPTTAHPFDEKDAFASALNTNLTKELTNIFFSFLGQNSDLDVEKIIIIIILSFIVFILNIHFTIGFDIYIIWFNFLSA